MCLPLTDISTSTPVSYYSGEINQTTTCSTATQEFHENSMSTQEFQHMIQSCDAAPTRTYQQCLRQSEMGALAEDIAITTAGEGVSKH